MDRNESAAPPTPFFVLSRLVKTALSTFEDNQLLVTVLASQVYTALNIWMEEVEDSDEHHFHELVAELVVSGLGARASD